MSKFKIINASFLGLAVLMVVGVNIYWKTSCSLEPCDYYRVIELLNPLEYTGFVLVAFFLFFLFLPVHYFEAWLKKIFSWAFPLAFITVLGTQSSGSVMSVSKSDVVVLNGVLWGFVTLIFVLYRRWKQKRNITLMK